jgi:hypothetical protein
LNGQGIIYAEEKPATTKKGVNQNHFETRIAATNLYDNGGKKNEGKVAIAANNLIVD